MPSVSSHELAAVIVVLAALVVIARNIAGFIRDVRPRPSTAELQSEVHREYATTEALASHASGDAGRFAAMDGHVTQLSGRITLIAESIRREMHELELRVIAAGDQRADKLHQRLDDVIKQIADLATGTAFRNRRP